MHIDAICKARLPVRPRGVREAVRGGFASYAHDKKALRLYPWDIIAGRC